MSRKLLALMISGMFAGGIATSALADDTPGTKNMPSAGTSSATSGKHDTSRASSGSGSIGTTDDVDIRGSQTKARTDTRGKSTAAGAAPQTRGDGIITTRDDASNNNSLTKGSASSGSAAGSSTTAAGTVNPNAASRDGVVTTRDENDINKSQTKGSASAPAGAGVSKSATGTSSTGGTSALGSGYGATGTSAGAGSSSGASTGSGGTGSGTAGATGGGSTAATGMDSTGIGTSPSAMSSGMSGAGMGQHSMQAKITSINPRTGKVSVRTDEGSLALHFPPEALADLKRGDTVTVHLGLSK